MADDGQNKTEKATPRKREKAKRKGDVVESKDLGSGFALTGAALMLLMFGSGISEGLKQSGRDFLGGLAHAPRLVEGAAAIEMIREVIRIVLRIVMPFLLVIAAVNLAALWTMHGLVWSPEKLSFNLGKLNPISGFGKIFSLSGIFKAVLAVLKLAVIGIVMWLSVMARWDDILRMSQFSTTAIVTMFAEIILIIFLRVGIAVLLLGLLDFSYQKWKKEKEMRMSKDEVKEERKQSEGDPKVKQKIRRLQMDKVRQRMIQDVDTATVVVTNPTHVAIALKYERGEYPAPQVVAKGLEHLAQTIKQRARDAGIPIVEEPPLARMLWRSVDVGDFVPPDLYRAVAAVLSYVFKRRSKTGSTS
jgi:flagellar biosynthetic protein FlhB